MSHLVKDLVYGVRMLLKSPGFTAVSVLTLALGIGANTALYGVASELLKSMAGVPHPEELVDVIGMRTAVKTCGDQILSGKQGPAER